MRPPPAEPSDEPATHFATRNADGSIAGRRNRLAPFEFHAPIVRFFRFPPDARGAGPVSLSEITSGYGNGLEVPIVVVVSSLFHGHALSD
jgi:hypothetical protein